jgi:hypothetical protein
MTQTNTFEEKELSMHQRTWQDLCRAIMDEKDPQKLLVLVEELNRALDDREQELRQRRRGVAESQL